MSMKVAKSARIALSLNAGINPGTGNMKKESVSISKIMPNADPDALGDVIGAVSSLMMKSVVSSNLVETSQIVV